MTLTGTPLTNDENSEHFDKNGNRLSSDSRNLSHGRGGVGNFGPDDNNDKESNGPLPHIRSPVYTTARGGTGNMQKNDMEHPEIARASQDVEMAPRRESQTEYHGSRGGAGNVFGPSEDELSHHSSGAVSGAPQSDYTRGGGLGMSKKYEKHAPVGGNMDHRGWADKGKAALLGRFSRNK